MAPLSQKNPVAGAQWLLIQLQSSRIENDMSLSRVQSTCRRKSLEKWGRDLLYPSYPELPKELGGPLLSHVTVPDRAPTGINSQAAIALGDRVLKHEFELLGGCPVSWNRKEPHTSANLVVRINQPNRAEAARVEKLLDPDYRPIDWHGIPGSGFRWPQDCWFKEIAIPYDSGVDIKLPWELARFQHGHTLALSYRLSGDGVYCREFRNQVLDFISSNPPRFGVHWRSPMEVAIRAANWVRVFDLVRRMGGDFGPGFEEELKRSLYAHGVHILENLEWTSGKRGNHYLANIAGLLFVAGYLPSTAVTDAWLAFAIQELAGEIEHQFHADGSFLEPSTGYHWLATEMVVRCLGFVQALPPRKVAGLVAYDQALVRSRPTLEPAPNPRFKIQRDRVVVPDSCLDTLRRACWMCLNLRNGDGTVPRIGDWDSGRFLPFSPSPLVEEAFTHSDFALEGLSLAGGGQDRDTRLQDDRPLLSYPNAGLHIFRAGPLRVLVRCGDLPAAYRSGHTHCDQLSIQVTVQGMALLIDPGNGSYNSDRALRDYFRSTRMHNTLSVAGREQHDWCGSPQGAFRLERAGRGRTRLVRPDRFEGRLEGAPYTHLREIHFHPGRIEVRDVVSPLLAATSAIHLHLDPECQARRLDRQRVRIFRGGLMLEATTCDGSIEVKEAVVASDYTRLRIAREVVIRPVGPLTRWSLTLPDNPVNAS